ncbi:MAG: HigA family addiction module antidote protein [Magnetococcales bacterium]|nr:HigA family addiction module antidote protein [Magnetococcales bacterium]
MESLPNVHPGEVLFEEFMQPLGMSQNRLARDIGVQPIRINQIIHGKRSITAETALRLSKYFGTSVGFWMGLQADYDVEVARTALGNRLEEEVAVLETSLLSAAM